MFSDDGVSITGYAKPITYSFGLLVTATPLLPAEGQDILRYDNHWSAHCQLNATGQHTLIFIGVERESHILVTCTFLHSFRISQFTHK